MFDAAFVKSLWPLVIDLDVLLDCVCIFIVLSYRFCIQLFSQTAAKVAKNHVLVLVIN